MDIRSIIDAEPSTSTPRRSAQGNRDEVRHEVKPSLQNPSSSFQSAYGASPPVYHASRDNRPPQPPPLQGPGNTDFRPPSASSYHSVQSPYTSAQSPYQQTSTFAQSGALYPIPQHQSPYNTDGPPVAQRDGHPGAPFPMNVSYSQYGHPTAMPQTPTASTPGSSSANYNQGRPPSSHSATTPTSAQPQAPYFPRQSPSTSHAQIRGQPQSFSAQQYLSQPGTPLGPPSTFAKSNAGVRRESPGSYGHSRNHSGGSYSYKSISAPSPSTEQPGSAFDSPSTIDQRQTQSINHRPSSSIDRERSLSVSPKTRLPSQSKIDVSKPPVDHYYAQRDLQPTIIRESDQDRAENRNDFSQPALQTPSRSFPLGVNGILNAPVANEHIKQTKESPGNATNISPQVITPPHGPPYAGTPSQADARKWPGSTPVEVTPSKRHATARQTVFEGQSPHIHSDLTSTVLIEEHRPSDLASAQPSQMPSKPATSTTQNPAQAKQLELKLEDEKPPASSLQPPVRKRLREEGIPLYAQSSRNGPSNNPFLSGKRPVKANSQVKSEPPSGTSTSQNPIQSWGAETNGHPTKPDNAQMPLSQPLLPGEGLLGPWEPSILNHIPYEEVTKNISDFLFNEVVMRDDVGVVSNKGVHSQQAVLEIEAKIGQLVDKASDTRIRLPVMSECIVCRSDPSLSRMAFKSSMTESQHRTLNGFLNRALVDSKPQKTKKGPSPPHSRVEMDYAHTYERDTFYNLAQSSILTLPKSIQDQIDPSNRRAKQKVRITTNSKTGQPIAQIIKVRVADMDVYSPQTLFDWRISVNVEMKIEGDFRRLIEPGDAGRTSYDRNKDRLSYKHSHYQIDLTQVTPTDAATKAEKEHELEIEVASQEIRKQGQLARDGQANRFEELVKGFADNVRTLVRHCKLE
ncbi:MAG: hypothetical protein Q9195_003097 [Heterodermia aff. obscurata]